MDFDPTLKKKKKKKVVLEDEDGVEAATEGMDDLNVDDDGFGEKKKKKKSKDKDKDADRGRTLKKRRRKKKKDADDEDGEDADAGDATNPQRSLEAPRDHYHDELPARPHPPREEPSLSEKIKTSSSPRRCCARHEEDGVRQPGRDLQRDELLPEARDPVHDGRAGTPGTLDASNG